MAEEQQNKQAKPTLQELKEFWMSRKQKERELQHSVSDDQPRPVVGTNQEQRPHKSYESMRAEWQKRRGLASKDEESLTMTPEQKQQQENYLRLKREFYNRMGRTMPEDRKQEWDDRLKRDQQKYNR